MDFVQASNYFDTLSFDSYDFTNNLWVIASFQGQLKRADDFISIWNRPTRKRMLYTSPYQIIPSSVVRVNTTGETFLVGHTAGDSLSNVHYRNLSGLHQVDGTATHRRKTPVEVSGVKGWAVESTVKTTFADVELRSVNEGQETQQLNYGNYFLFMPFDSDLRRHDTVELNSVRYYVLDVYLDSGMRCGRATVQPDERVNFTFSSVGAPVYNPATQTSSSTNTSYNVTGKIVPLLTQDIKNSDVIRDRVKVLLLESFISFTPKVGDSLTYLGTTYTVDIVQRDASLEEFVILASA